MAGSCFAPSPKDFKAWKRGAQGTIERATKVDPSHVPLHVFLLLGPGYETGVVAQ